MEGMRECKMEKKRHKMLHEYIKQREKKSKH